MNKCNEKILKYERALSLLTEGTAERNQEQIKDGLELFASMENPADEREENAVRKIFEVILRKELYDLAFVPGMIKKLAEQGNAVAQCRLGWMYMEGRGVEQDLKKAVEWYRKAAEQGNASGQCNLGRRYEYGQGVEQDYEEAVKWYTKSAEQEYAPTKKAAKKALERLAEQGNYDAEEALEKLKKK
ncbi:tetratricopeptide repeat protein [Treponema sp.]|uniref:tetratricopeptide repeat protein n=1 Tax=Treponema sp. TaxID=166 RepID=UPI003F10E727